MDGIDWAYRTLVGIAEAQSYSMLILRASQFKPEVLDACFGMACADIDWHINKPNCYAYVAVRDVCGEMTRLMGKCVGCQKEISVGNYCRECTDRDLEKRA